MEKSKKEVKKQNPKGEQINFGKFLEDLLPGEIFADLSGGLPLPLPRLCSGSVPEQQRVIL